MPSRANRAILGFGLCLAALLSTAPAWAQTPYSTEQPFAEKHVILQVSQAEPARFSLALDIAMNLGKHYGGQDMVDIQIITFGGGVPFLFADDNPQRKRVEVLMAHGVRFFVCGNTLDTIERRDKRRPVIVPGVQTVQTGVAYMLEEIERGYVHVQP